MCAVSISNFVYFYSFHGLKVVSLKNNNKLNKHLLYFYKLHQKLAGSPGQQSALRDLLFACCAGHPVILSKCYLCKHSYKGYCITKSEVGSHLLIAGSINVFLTNPLWVVNQRLKMAGLDPTAPR